MPKSKEDLGLLALQTMRVVEGDAAPEINDTSVIEDAYDEVYAMLNELHLVTWGISESIPDEFVNPIKMLTAEARLTMFTVPPDVQAIILSKASTAVMDISEMVALDYVPDPIPSEPL